MKKTGESLGVICMKREIRLKEIEENVKCPLKIILKKILLDFNSI